MRPGVTVYFFVDLGCGVFHQIGQNTVVPRFRVRVQRVLTLIQYSNRYSCFSPFRLIAFFFPKETAVLVCKCGVLFVLGLGRCPTVNDLRRRRCHAVRDHRCALVSENYRVRPVVVAQEHGILRRRSADEARGRRVQRDVIVHSHRYYHPFPFFMLPTGVVFLLQAIRRFLHASNDRQIGQLRHVRVRLPTRGVLGVRSVTILTFRYLGRQVNFRYVNRRLQARLAIRVSQRMIPREDGRGGSNDRGGSCHADDRRRQGAIRFQRVGTGCLFRYVLVGSNRLVLGLGIPPRYFAAFLFRAWSNFWSGGPSKVSAIGAFYTLSVSDVGSS